MEVVAALVRIQQNGRLTDAAFAGTLGIPRQTWQYYKGGGAFSLRFLQLAVRVYPQIRPQAERLIFGTDAKKSSTKPRAARTA